MRWEAPIRHRCFRRVFQALLATALLRWLVLVTGGSELLWLGPQGASNRVHRGSIVRHGLKFDLSKPAPARRRGRVVEEKAEEEEEDDDEEVVEEEVIIPRPVLYEGAKRFQRLHRQPIHPGHLIQRKWLQKGLEQGYVTVPFSPAVRAVTPVPAVNIALIGKRERTQEVVEEWSDILDEDEEAIPFFDITGEVKRFEDFDPAEPPYGEPLSDLTNDEKYRKMFKDAKVREQLLAGRSDHLRDEQEIRALGERYRMEEDAKVLRAIVEGLPEELKTEERTLLIRKTSSEVLSLLWTMYVASNSTRMRWRLACAEGPDPQDRDEVSLRAVLLLAGEGVEFVPSKYVDPEKELATRRLSDEQLRRTTDEDWAASVTATGTNVTEALKRVPPGWIILLKGNKWPDNKGRAAVHRMSPSGRRLFIQVDLLKGPVAVEPAPEAQPEPAAESSEEGTEPEEVQEVPSYLKWLGPLAGVAALLLRLARNTPPYQFGAQKRTEFNETIRAITRVSDSEKDREVTEELNRFEMRSAGSVDSQQAPVVMVVGGGTPTGQVITRKLVNNGVHVVSVRPGVTPAVLDALKKSGSTNMKLVEESLFNFTSYAGTPDPVPAKLYDAVTGIDKFVICACDKEELAEQPPGSLPIGKIVSSALSTWQRYRLEFADLQKAYATKVRLFDFSRATDRRIFSIEWVKETDLRYGWSRCGWAVDKFGKGLFIGWFHQEVGQCLLKSQTLKLNFKRFSGLMLNCYNQSRRNEFSFFLRNKDFEETRVQFEYDFTLLPSRWHHVRMQFNAFRPRRVDGAELPPEEAVKFELDRAGVIQMGIVIRTKGMYRKYAEGRNNYFSLHLSRIQAYRTQAEPQVILVQNIADGAGTNPWCGGQDLGWELEPEEESGEALESDFSSSFSYSDETLAEDVRRRKREEKEAEKLQAELREVERKEAEAASAAAAAQGLELPRTRTAAQAVMTSGLSFSIISVNGLNQHPGGQYPLHIHQIPVSAPHLSVSSPVRGLSGVSRADVAELVVSALSQPSCVNTEIVAGEPGGDVPLPPEEAEGEEKPETSFQIDVRKPILQIRSTAEEDVKKYLKQLVANT